jgi:hypothetical protein
MCKDDYTYSQILTVGGLGGTAGTTYVIESPFSGSEYEYQILGITTGDAAGQYQAIISADQPITSLPYDGTVSIGAMSQAPFTTLKGQTFRSGPTNSIPPADTWVRVSNGAKYVYVRAFTPAASAIFVAVQFRFLPVRVIPARVHTVPDGAEDQINIAREQAVIDRLEMDIEKGDMGVQGYGKLR